MRFFGKFSRSKWRPLIVSLVGFKHQLVNTAHEGERGETTEKEDLRTQCIKKIDGWAASFVRENKIPGMSISVSVDNNTILHEGYGVRDRRSTEPFRADTKGDISSVTKLITAHCYMNLVITDKRALLNPFQQTINGATLRRHLPILPDTFYQYSEGKDNLDEERGKWIKETIRIREEDDKIYAVLLFCHRAGIRQSKSFRDEEHNKTYFQNETRAIQWFFDKHESRHVFKSYPGTEFLYSCIGYLMIGAIMDHELREKVDPADRSNYRDYVIKEMRKLGMNDTMWRHTSQLHNVDNYAVGYTHPITEDGNFDYKKEIEESERDVDYSNLYPARGLISTVADMVTFGNAYLTMMSKAKGDEGHDFPFSAAQIAPMWGKHSSEAEVVSADTGLRRETGCGLGWNISTQQLAKDWAGDQYADKDADSWFQTNCFKVGRSHGFTSFLCVSFLISEDSNPFLRTYVNWRLKERPEMNILRRDVIETDPDELNMYDELSHEAESDEQDLIFTDTSEDSSGNSHPGDSKIPRITQGDESAGDQEMIPEISDQSPSRGELSHYSPTSGEKIHLNSAKCGGDSGIPSSHENPKDFKCRTRRTAREIHRTYLTFDDDDDDDNDDVHDDFELCLEGECCDGMPASSEDRLIIRYSSPGKPDCPTYVGSVYDDCSPAECKDSDGDSDEDSDTSENYYTAPSRERSGESSSGGTEGSKDASSNECSGSGDIEKSEDISSPEESDISDESESVNLNPLISIGLIANLNSVKGSAIISFTDRINSEIRCASKNGAFPK